MLGVEVAGVVQKAAVAGVARARVVGVGVIEALELPAAVCGELADRVGAGGDELPELLGRGDPARVAAAHADDRDGLVELRAGRALPPVGRARCPATSRSRYPATACRRRVVEDSVAGSFRPGGLVEAVLSSIAPSESKPSSLKGRLGIDRLRRCVPKHRGDVSADEL